MKRTVRPLAVLLVAAFLLLSLAGCTAIADSEAEELVRTCLDAFARGDYEAADACFHPAARQDAAFVGCREYAETLRSRHRIDLTRGYTVTDWEGFATPGLSDAFYDVTFEGTVGGLRVAISAVLYRDADGFGIFELTVAPIKETTI